jgi:hypothetical protein
MKGEFFAYLFDNRTLVFIARLRRETLELREKSRDPLVIRY